MQRRQKHDKRLRQDAQRLVQGDMERVHSFDQRKASVKARIIRRRERMNDNSFAVDQRWKQARSDLEAERGLFGNMNPSADTMYALDPTEGPWRMRKKVCTR